MLRWVVAFLEENKPKWDEIRRKRHKDEEEQKEYERWKELEEGEKKKLAEKEMTKTCLSREERLKLALEKKQAWKKWRQDNEEDQGDCHNEEEEEEKEVEDKEDEEWLGNIRYFCIHCAMQPCSCALVKLEEKIRQIRKDSEGRGEEADLIPERDQREKEKNIVLVEEEDENKDEKKGRKRGRSAS